MFYAVIYNPSEVFPIVARIENKRVYTIDKALGGPDSQTLRLHLTTLTFFLSCCLTLLPSFHKYVKFLLALGPPHRFLLPEIFSPRLLLPNFHSLFGSQMKPHFLTAMF